MNTHSSTTTELALIKLSLKIGSIADSNAPFTRGLAQYIDSQNKPLNDLTVIELAALVDNYAEIFNSKETPTTKTSRFNVLAKSSLKVIAKNVSFHQAKQFHNCVIKFSCMSSAPGEEVAL